MKYFKKKRSVSRKRRFRRRFPNRKRFARRVMRVVNTTAEKKISTITGGATTLTINNGGIAYPCVQIVQGTGRGARVGNKIFVRYIRINATFYSNDAANVVWRTSLVRSRGPNALIGDFPTSYENQNYDIDKFIVIWDHYFHTGNMNTTDKGIIHFRKSTYVGASQTFNDNVSSEATNGQFYWFVWTNDSIVPSPYMQYEIQTTFTDF